MKKEYLILIPLTVSQGSVHPLGKIAMEYITPFQLAFVRSSLTFLTLIAIVALSPSLRSSFRMDRRDILISISLGAVSFFIMQIFLFKALDLNPASINGLLVNTNPIFIAILGFFVLKEGLNTKNVLGMIVSFVGVYFVVTNSFGGMNIQMVSVMGAVFALLGALCASINVIGSRSIMRRRGGSVSFTTIASLSGALLLSALVGMTDGVDEIFRAPILIKLNLLYIGVIATGLAYTGWYFCLKRLEAIKVAVFAYLIPVFALLLSILLLGEWVTVPFLVGMGLIFLGIKLIQ